MPVLLDRGPHHSFKAEKGRLDGTLSKRGGLDENCLVIGLVNNMPDAALEATERQFIELLGVAADDLSVRLKFFSLPEVPRSDSGRAYVNSGYLDPDDLWNSHLDALIVTGTEPRASNLRDEPYWATLVDVMDWAERNTISTVWSCLAAHAAVLHLDGIRRQPLPDKRFGVFDFAKVSNHPIVRDAPAWLRNPHSRWNDLPEKALSWCGYDIVAKSAEAGIDMFTKKGRSLFVFFQGHPEYKADTLFREYRRDVGRFLRGERESYPTMPVGYFDQKTTAMLNAFREKALVDRGEQLLASFPDALLAAKAPAWASQAALIYRNWLSHIAEQKYLRSRPVQLALDRRSTA